MVMKSWIHRINFLSQMLLVVLSFFQPYKIITYGLTIFLSKNLDFKIWPIHKYIQYIYRYDYIDLIFNNPLKTFS